MTYALEKKVTEALKWFEYFDRRAQQHHDLLTSADLYNHIGLYIKAKGGDLPGAISMYQRCLDLCAQTGDTKHGSYCLLRLADTYLALGDFHSAAEYASRGLEIAQAGGNTFVMRGIDRLMVAISLAQGNPVMAINVPQGHALPIPPELEHFHVLWAPVLLGRAYLGQGESQQALQHFQEAMAVMDDPALIRVPGLKPLLVSLLSGLEEAYETSADFQAFCRHYQAEHPELPGSSLRQWFLEPVPQDFGFTILDFGLEKDNLQSEIQNLKWIDPFGDCSFRVEDGLEIHAANGRDLWHINLSAPRLLHIVSGDFAAQTLCLPVSAEQPAIGGLLLWQDEENYLYLNRGATEPHQLLFGGCLDNKDVVIGRGRLWGLEDKTAVVFQPEPIYLRLERLGQQVKALCSADGQAWYTVGQVEFPVEDPVEVGLHAIGNIDRTIYRGAYPDGTAIRFESFQVWKRPPTADHRKI